MTRLEVRDISKKFGHIAAVDGVSLTLEEHELVALVGPSGCGKTTLLRLIAGFERPDSGEILLDGRNVNSLRPENRQVGIVFQDYALFPHMSVEKNIAYGLKFVDRMSPQEKQMRIDELLNMINLGKHRFNRPEELSAGQQQRVALARTLAPRPRLILLDEPFSALDRKLREELRFELKALQRDIKVAMIHVTHDQEEALAVADRVAVMNQGAIEQMSVPWEVYQRPQTEFVARFVGRGNVLSARILRVDEKNVVAALQDGQEVRLRKVTERVFAVDETIKILVRPERLAVSSNAENQLECILQGSEFLGDAVLLHVKIAGELCFSKITAASAESIQNTEGQMIRLGFCSEDASIL